MSFSLRDIVLHSCVCLQGEMWPSIQGWLAKAVRLITTRAIPPPPQDTCLLFFREQCKLFQLSLSEQTPLNLSHLYTEKKLE